MRELYEVTRFEIRHQLRSPFFLGALLIFALIHFLSITGTVIHLADVSNQIPINSTYTILRVELTLFVFSILPIVAFVTTAMTRDYEYATAPLIFVTPASPKYFVLGRFFGALIPALLIGLAGLLGAMMGSFSPWLDQTRIVPFSLLPWGYVFLVVILPNTIALCALFFSVAALTRSFALTFASAMAFFVAVVFLNLNADFAGSSWAALADPSARLTVAAETRYWTIPELTARMPLGILLQNRLFWLSVTMFSLIIVSLRFRLDLAERAPFSFRRPVRRDDKTHHHPPPAIKEITPILSFSPRAALSQLYSQLKMDLGCIFKSPLIYIIITLTIIQIIGEILGNVSRIGLVTPHYPLTSQMMPILRFGMFGNILLVCLWYSAELIHRERSARTSEIINASPFPDWLLILSKTTALFAVINALMLVAILTMMAWQTAAGYTNFEIGLYLQSAFIYNGFNYGMVCVLAVFMQVISPNKWLGLLLTLVAYIALLSLGPMGYDHPLYNFGIPEAVYSDMNGFGHYLKPVFALIAYWGAFCVLLLIAGHLLYPRGNYSAVRERLRDARTRFGSGVRLATGLTILVFFGIGGWIYYNTNVLNEYLTPHERLRRRADYERNYGRYDNASSPSYDRIEMAVDIYPAERRLVSRGSAILGNHKQTPIDEFVVTINPALRVNEITVENAALSQSDNAQGFYLFRLHAPLAPGATVKMTWQMTRQNDGFAAGEPDNKLVANGTYLDTIGVMPIPGYDSERRITDIAERRRFGLPPAPRVPKLGDPAFADKVGFGIDSRTAFEVVLSTSADQVAVAPGVLQREWQQDGRRYFHYQAEQPILPNLSFVSARYRVARDRWKNIDIEIYHDPKHTFSIDAMMSTAKRALEFYSTEFAPYQYPYYRILECPRYLTGARFHSGTAPFSEAISFVNDLREVENADYGVMHELAHMWWGERIAGAQIQGRWMLTENMADYSAMMLFKEYYPPVFINRLTWGMLDSYLKARSEENEAELPVMYTERHGYLRAKGPLALFALQDIIGREKVGRALRNFLSRYSFQTSPCPTSRDLVDALRAEAGPEYQGLITDLFEKIVLYDLQLDAATLRKVDDGYEVAIEVNAKQFEANERGEEKEVPLDSWFDIALFPSAGEDLDGITPLYIAKHRLRSGKQNIKIHTREKPVIAALDPFRKMIERSPGNNRLAIEEPREPDYTRGDRHRLLMPYSEPRPGAIRLNARATKPIR